MAGLPATSIGFETLAEGEHELELNAGGKTRRVIFDSAEGPSLAIFLRTDRNVGGLRIHTGEDGATIYLDGKKYRRLTRRGRALIYLYPNQYTVRIEKQGFRVPAEQTVRIRKGEQSRLDFKLTPLPTTATLKIPNGMPGATVLIDGTRSASFRRMAVSRRRTLSRDGTASRFAKTSINSESRAGFSKRTARSRSTVCSKARWERCAWKSARPRSRRASAYGAKARGTIAPSSTRRCSSKRAPTR